MSANLARGSTLHLRIVQVGLHDGIRVDEPHVNEASHIGGVLGRAVDGPRERVVEDRVGKVAEVSDVVQTRGTDIRIKLSVTTHIWARRPDCHQKSCQSTA